MTDPAHQPTSSNLRNFSRKVREATMRQERQRQTPHTDDSAPPEGFHEHELQKALAELQLAEEELRLQNEELIASRDSIDEERQRYRDLFDSAPDAYLITDLHGNIREANRAAASMLGTNPKFLAGKPLPSFFDETGRRAYRQQLDRICDFDRLDDWEIFIQPRKSERIAVSVTIARAKATDKTGGYQWILRDISKRVRAEEALRELNRELESRATSRTAQLAVANRVKDELLISERRAREEAEVANRVKVDFLTLLSHEFRTPLQAIFGYTELLECQIHGPLNEAQLRDLHRMQQSQQHLLGLINTILDFARLDSGREIEVEIHPTVVHHILGEMDGFIGSELEKRELKYHYHCQPNIVASTDPAKLQQIILNLLANALKFTPAGGEVSLDCMRERDSVLIRVIDSGIGIPPDKLEAIFQPFVQIRRRDVSTEGTGLGLPISRRLATAMGGTLSASNNPEHGSTFSLRLPLA